MPELPEVESVVRSLRPLLIGRQILALQFPAEQRPGEWPATLRRLLDAPPQRMREQVGGARIVEVARCGKNILIGLTSAGDKPGDAMGRQSLLVHLGMTGRLTSEVSCVPHSRHTHLIFELDDAVGSERDQASAKLPRWLHFADIRRFGRVRVSEGAVSGGTTGAPAGLGPEPLEIGEAEFISRLRARKAKVKAVLLDQSFVRGLGNIYADESLFRAGIYPAKIAARIRTQQASALRLSIRAVLQEAISAGGSSISDYVDGQGRQGWFQMHHRVYQRTGEPCQQCKTAIRRIIVAGRSTHFCPHCQPGRMPRARGKGKG
ncbi:MAG: bifunctional DNA-formamidopyrimidine glycosylase/DNA-(apurinic or apyrimidinic site) lyase [Acidobacteria bacterium]|nr:bifunctional DNA-formamidopyrimidine glycosylase/DNA-(apurinic or apyrimidinic site) lyase [Acidobacteriota bacterium]